MIRNTFFVCLFIAGVVSSCSNEFDVVDDWQDIPIIYGLLSISDTAQYIRVEKAFLDPQTSALDIAQIADSLYYENAQVQLRKINFFGPGETYELERVNANLEGYVKEDGIFATDPNYLYKTTEQLDPSAAHYRLIVKRGDGLPDVTAVTNVIDDFESFRPRDGDIINFNPLTETLFVWEVNENASFFSAEMELKYFEFPIGNPGQAVSKTLNWTLISRFKPNGTAARLEIFGERFFNFLAANIPVNTSLCRQMGSATLFIDAGGEDLLRHIEVFEANQSGITGLEPFPSYTNLSEGEGGFFYPIPENSAQYSIITGNEGRTGQWGDHRGFRLHLG